MAKFLFTANYTADGAKGLSKDGGSARYAQVEKVVKSLGGKLEAWYYAFGDIDLYVIADLPDAATAAAFSLAVNKTGAVKLKTTPLLSLADMDAATKKSVEYRPPGS